MIEDASSAAKLIAGVVTKKTQEVIDYSKKKLSVMEIENELSQHYTLLGKYCYARLYAELEQKDEIRQTVLEISRLNGELKKRTEAMNGAKMQNACGECGNQNSEQAVFCSACGHKL